MPGIAEQSVHDHLEDIRTNISLFAPDAKVEVLEVYATEQE